MCHNWFVSALLALIIYGFWGFFPKLAVSYISPQSALVYQVAGGMLVGALALFLVGFRPESHPLGVLFAILTGITGVLGTLFYYAAASRGNISIVVSMTALYPLITICLAFFILHEPLTFKQIIGMVFAIVAIILFSS
jgi:transporter family protein